MECMIWWTVYRTDSGNRMGQILGAPFDGQVVMAMRDGNSKAICMIHGVFWVTWISQILARSSGGEVRKQGGPWTQMRQHLVDSSDLKSPEAALCCQRSRTGIKVHEK